MSNLDELKLEEKEFGYCLIPMIELREEESTLKDNEMGVYIPKLLNSLPSTHAITEEVTIDYSIVKNKKYSKKRVETCNYIITQPYKQTNMSPPLFDKQEKCFIKFLYTDIKKPFFLYENMNTNKTVKKGDKKKFFVEDGSNGQYGLTLDTFKGVIELCGASKNASNKKLIKNVSRRKKVSGINSIKIDQGSDIISLMTDLSEIKLSPDNILIENDLSNINISSEELTLTTEGSNININNDSIKLESSGNIIKLEDGNVDINATEINLTGKINLNGDIYINGKKLDVYLEEMIKDLMQGDDKIDYQ